MKKPAILYISRDGFTEPKQSRTTEVLKSETLMLALHVKIRYY